jgi:hypothetical protein
VDVERPDIVKAVASSDEVPDAVLVRPDGYVAWASERVLPATELATAIGAWSVQK